MSLPVLIDFLPCQPALDLADVERLKADRSRPAFLGSPQVVFKGFVDDLLERLFPVNGHPLEAFVDLGLQVNSRSLDGLHGFSLTSRRFCTLADMHISVKGG
jgi:hypothetical protein